MSLPYLDQDTRDDIQRARDNGRPVEQIAGQIGISSEDLCRLMGWPQWRQVPTDEVVQ